MAKKPAYTLRTGPGPADATRAALTAANAPVKSKLFALQSIRALMERSPRYEIMKMSSLSSWAIWAATTSGRSLARPRTKTFIPTVKAYSVNVRRPLEPSTSVSGPLA